jgi:quercetin dioxygenase-like cupin family protein
MLVRKAQDVQSKQVDMNGARGVKMALLVGRSDGAPNFAMRRFNVEPGGHTPRHQHPYEHEVLITRGRGCVFSQSTGEVSVQAGDVLFIPADELHQFRNTSPLIMEFICLIPVTAADGAPTPGAGNEACM